MNRNLQRLHDLCATTYDKLAAIPLDDHGQGASYDAAQVLYRALNQARDSVFWGDARDRVRDLEDKQ
jgi:hypothetical protein